MFFIPKAVFLVFSSRNKKSAQPGQFCCRSIDGASCWSKEYIFPSILPGILCLDGAMVGKLTPFSALSSDYKTNSPTAHWFSDASRCFRRSPKAVGSSPASGFSSFWSLHIPFCMGRRECAGAAFARLQHIRNDTSGQNCLRPHNDGTGMGTERYNHLVNSAYLLTMSWTYKSWCSCLVPIYRSPDLLCYFF